MTENDYEKSYTLVTNSFATYKVSIGKNTHANAWTFPKTRAKNCASISFGFFCMFVECLKKVNFYSRFFLTDAECSEIFGNTPPVPNGLKYVHGARNQSRQDIVTSLLLNDRRNCQPRVWVFKRKEMQRGTIPCYLPFLTTISL